MSKIVLIGGLGVGAQFLASAPMESADALAVLNRMGVAGITIGLMVWLYQQERRERVDQAERHRDQMSEMWSRMDRQLRLSEEAHLQFAKALEKLADRIGD